MPRRKQYTIPNPVYCRAGLALEPRNVAKSSSCSNNLHGLHHLSGIVSISTNPIMQAFLGSDTRN